MTMAEPAGAEGAAIVAIGPERDQSPIATPHSERPARRPLRRPVERRQGEDAGRPASCRGRAAARLPGALRRERERAAPREGVTADRPQPRPPAGRGYSGGGPVDS